MATVWYCCQCKNGPMSIANNPQCTGANCTSQHHQCGYCETEIAHADYDFDLTDTHTHGFASLIHPHANSMHAHGELVDGNETYRWQCCNCHSDNSCEYNKGCYNCSHWRCSTYCSVYAIKN
ncbi:hypothetical protein BU25DRAFT_414882 [Macroventuria anomochaeta]|uniref:Uncharacterized protein n=1 Tax=Macroventuria anomochaeta TaxID=301207 RepID=A0ACB6RP44_9PLEO|nr:uncharacterized protein BU25DRAFT_414882 [Macroventuria anomochaeta]KAF2622898.1 hypothetical protein BU25DRAFT_414882 [Macroventuria anomochaeta]